uniref:Protein AF-17 n=1 Tax=Schistocephalus solidus TaxID=70667 RepID=A0A0X3PJD5_SCHSO
MDGSCAVCFKAQGSFNNKIIRCGNCGVFVHQGCYGILKLPNFGNWFCRKCESQVRMSKIKCEFCPTKNGAFKRCNSNRCGWSHVLCALFIPEVKFADNQSMDLVLTESVPSERFNKSCVFCERNQQNAMSTYGACLQCSWRTCKANFHVTCAAQAGVLILPPVSGCSPQNTIAMLLKGTPSDNAHSNDDVKEVRHSTSLLAFCSNAHMTKHTQHCPLPPRTTVKAEVSPNALAVIPHPSASANHCEHGGSPRTISSEDLYSRSLSSLRPLTADRSPTTYTEPIPASADEATELPLSAPSIDSAPAIASSPIPHSKSHVPSNFPSTPETTRPQIWHPVASPVDNSGAAQESAPVIKPESKLKEQAALTPEASPSSSDTICRRVPRRNAALLANKEFMAARKHRKESEEAKCGSTSSASVSTGTTTSGVRSKLSHTMPVSRKLTISAAKKAKLAARVRQHKGGRKVLSAKTNPSCVSSTGQSTNSTLKSAASSNSHATPPNTDTFLPGVRDPFWSTSLRLVPPPLPLSVRDLGLKPGSFQGPGDAGTAEIGNLHTSTMQYLLEWQWEQGGTLLMQQAETTDVVTLLNCLHQLKAENDSLEAKLLRLQSKREHLKSVNARLSASLTTLESMTHTDYGTTWSPDIHVPPVLALPSVMPSAVPAPSKRPGSLLTHPDSQQKVSLQTQAPRVAAVTSTAPTICSSYRPLFPAACTTQNSPSEDLRDLSTLARSKSSLSGPDSKQKRNANGGIYSSGTPNESNLMPSLLQRAVNGANPILMETSLQPGVRPTIGPVCRPSLPLTPAVAPLRRNSESLTALLQPQARVSEPLQQTRLTSTLLPRLQPRVPAKNLLACPLSAPSSSSSSKDTRPSLLSDCSAATSCRFLVGQAVTTSAIAPSMAFLHPVITASANTCPVASSASSLICTSSLVPVPPLAADETTAGVNLTPLLVSSFEKVALSSSCVSLHSTLSSSSSPSTASPVTPSSSSSSSLLLDLNLPTTATTPGQNLQPTRSSTCSLDSYAAVLEEKSEQSVDPVTIAVNSSTVVTTSSLVSSDLVGTSLVK